MTHSNINENEIDEIKAIGLAAEGDNNAFSVLFIRYLPKIRSVAKRYAGYCADYDDIVQEGVIGLYKAVKAYEVQKGVPFQAFALLCIKRQIINAAQKYSRYPEILSDFSSQNLDICGRNSDLLLHTYSNPEDLVMGKEGFETAKEYIRDRLSDFEYDVLRHYLTGIKYCEIAKMLGKTPKSIDNAVSRIKTKLFKGLNCP